MASHRHVVHLFSLWRQVLVQEMFDFEQPAVQAFDLRQLVFPDSPLSHNGLKACQLLRTQPAHGPPFLPSCCRLASISSKIALSSTVAYLKGWSPSVFSAVTMPVAYSSSTASCLASGGEAVVRCFLICLRTSLTLGCRRLRMAVLTCLSASKAVFDASRSAWNWHTWCGTSGHSSSTANSSLSWASVIVPSTFTPNTTTGESRAFITAVSDDVTFRASSTRPVSASRTR